MTMRILRSRRRQSSPRVSVASALFLLLTTFTAAPMPAQQLVVPTGNIAGRVIDASGNPLGDVGVQIVGTTLGAQTGIDGTFRVRNVPAGTVGIQARRIGFSPKSITGLMLPAGQTMQVDISLQSAAAQLTAQVVSAEAERGTVSDALDQQRTAVGVVSSITREQISRSPDADAAQAVQRVSGVTVQDGKYVQVRGLGDRYTTASLNGSRLPSPEPERKVVPLDLFPSSLIQSVTTSNVARRARPPISLCARAQRHHRAHQAARDARRVGVARLSVVRASTPTVPSTAGDCLDARDVGEQQRSHAAHETPRRTPPWRHRLPLQQGAIARGANRIWRECELRTAAAEGNNSTVQRLFGAIIERDGRFKFLSYANQF